MSLSWFIIVLLGCQVQAREIDANTIRTAAKEDPLVGTKAVLQSLNGHNPVNDTKITAEFVEYDYGLRVVGSTGCNQYEFAYQQVGNLLKVSGGVVTQLLCLEPEDTMNQEKEYLDTLKEVASFRVSGNDLEMQNESGERILLYKIG